MSIGEGNKYQRAFASKGKKRIWKLIGLFLMSPFFFMMYVLFKRYIQGKREDRYLYIVTFLSFLAFAYGLCVVLKK